jgi:trimethylamine--corrinoid protein Co-methyltransferase
MTVNYLEVLSQRDLDQLHKATLEILSGVGVRFPVPEAQAIFRQHGFQVEGDMIYFQENQVLEAVDQVPDQFTMHSRNPARQVTIGGDSFVLAPGYGAPFLIDPEHGKRTPTLQDYQDLIRLNQVLPNQDLTGYLLVEPQDLPADQAHLHMLEAALTLSDKPFLGSAENRQAAEDTLAMAEILYGSPLREPVCLGVISALSPLAYSPDMIEAVLVYARHNQPMIFANLVMAGSTGPITLAGMIAQQNAELLAGITLAQLVQPGVPLLYGTTSTNIDMRSGALVLGSPELSLVVTAHAQLARYYRLPSRAGGALTDASVLDAQAGYESMFGLLSAANSGIHFVLHAGGIMSSYLAFSPEKLIMDDELCGMIRCYRKGLEISPETLDLTGIQAVGPGGHYLNQPQTLRRCRTEFWQPALADRSGLEAWWSGDRADTALRAGRRVENLLEEYTEPDLDPTLRRQLVDYITGRAG